MDNFSVHPIGKACNNESGTWIEVENPYISALQALEGYSYIQVLWWFSECDNEQARSVLQIEQPYEGAPKKMGVFATRSPERPNPIALTAAEIIHINFEKGKIQVAFLDADDGTPVLDIKPYTPSFDRVETPAVPAWCSHWPKSAEESGSFPWEKVFHF